MPDILHWLGITKIDRMLSMSNMKYDAIVGQGIPILERVPIPDWMIPEDGQVEIEAKVHAGYFAGQPGEAATRWAGELEGVHGRGWDDIDVMSPLRSVADWIALRVVVKTAVLERSVVIVIRIGLDLNWRLRDREFLFDFRLRLPV